MPVLVGLDVALIPGHGEGRRRDLEHEEREGGPRRQTLHLDVHPLVVARGMERHMPARVRQARRRRRRDDHVESEFLRFLRGGRIRERAEEQRSAGQEDGEHHRHVSLRPVTTRRVHESVSFRERCPVRPGCSTVEPSRQTQSPPSRSSPPEARWATRSFGVSVWHTGQRCLARAGLRLTASALGPLPEVRVSSPRGAPPAYPGPRACRVGSNEYVQTIPDGVYWTLVLPIRPSPSDPR